MCAFCLLSLLVTSAWGQQTDIFDRPMYETAPGTGVLIFAVYGEKRGRPLDRQALLKLVNLGNQTATWQTTEDASQGVFTNVAYGSYEVEVSAVGYLSAHEPVQMMNTWQARPIDIVLNRDPSATNLDVADGIFSPKVRKEIKRAVAALKSGRLNEAQRQLSAAYQLAPSSSALNFLLGYLYFQKKDYAQASNYLGTATNLKPHDAQALTLLGRAGLELQDYGGAESALEQAVAADAENWLPHDLLADAYLHQGNYRKAQDEAEVAIAKGRAEASPAQLILGQALFGLGHGEQGIQVLEDFVNEEPGQPLAGKVRNWIAQIQESESAPGVQANEVADQLRVSGIDPLAAVAAPRLSVKSWQPPGIDETKLTLAPGAVCPSETVIEEAGKSVEELVNDVSRFAAVEDLFHQSVDAYGNPIRTETRKYNYVAEISETQPDSFSVDEYRAARLGLSDYPDQIASTGFAALALVFHPHQRDEFDMKCEGLGDWHGQASWLVRFSQRDNKPIHIHGYKVGDLVYPVELKGRAWITADRFQIVHIESELLHPMPEIKLLSEHQVVEYGPIRFDQKNTTLWLPKSAEIYFEFRHHRYYRRHSFDHYMLFSVESDETRKGPTIGPPAVESKR